MSHLSLRMNRSVSLVLAAYNLPAMSIFISLPGAKSEGTKPKPIDLCSIGEYAPLVTTPILSWQEEWRF